MLQTILKDVCYENIDCILKLLDESGAENSTVVVLKKTERSFKGNCCIFYLSAKTTIVVGLIKTERSFKGKCCIAVVLLLLTMILFLGLIEKGGFDYSELFFSTNGFLLKML